MTLSSPRQMIPRFNLGDLLACQESCIWVFNEEFLMCIDFRKICEVFHLFWTLDRSYKFSISAFKFISIRTHGCHNVRMWNLASLLWAVFTFNSDNSPLLLLFSPLLLRSRSFNGWMLHMGSDACRATQAGRTPYESQRLLPLGDGEEPHRFTSTEGQ